MVYNHGSKRNKKVLFAMSLRTRLFIWIGTLFFLAFLSSFLVEQRVTANNFADTHDKIEKQVFAQYSKKREAIQGFLFEMLERTQAEIDALLQRIYDYPFIREGFAPDDSRTQSTSYLDVSSLMITNRWVDFIQSVNEGKLSSQIILDSSYLHSAKVFHVAEDFALVALHTADTDQTLGPFIAVPLQLQHYEPKDFHPPYQKNNLHGTASYYVLFSPSGLRQLNLAHVEYPSLLLSVNFLEPFLKWVEVVGAKSFVKEFIEKVALAKQKLDGNPSLIPSPEAWHQMHVKRDREDGSDAERVFFNRYLDRYDKIGMIWGLSVLFETGAFGKSPHSERFPSGILQLRGDLLQGKAMLTKDVIPETFFFDPSKAKDVFYSIDSEGDALADALTPIVPTEVDYVFFGNTVKFSSPSGKTSFLTIGKHGYEILGNLAQATRAISLFVSDNRVVKVFGPNGLVIDDEIWKKVPLKEMLANKTGFFSLDNKEYFYLHMSPNPKIDAHFYLISLKNEEFFLLDKLNAVGKELITNVAGTMRLVTIGGLILVLFILHHLSKRITKPITTLAKATASVAKGELEKVDLPQITNHKDEIAKLYDGFSSMVKGLKEKEKVRGILNKVVSPEIAEETLKGKIHLGGEEKKVTVFFADIRNFTHITEHMSPKEVIELLNSCMTRVSKVIDQFGGVIDKYVGDEVMALYGAPIEKEGSALSAVHTAVSIRDALIEWKKENEKVAIEMGFGIHTGNVVAGNMGAENRLNYTVLGANVNLASRLCSLAKPMEILISEATFNEPSVSHSIEAETVSDVSLKGFSQAVVAYRVLKIRT